MDDSHNKETKGDIFKAPKSETISSLRGQIDDLQREISRIYTEELFRARIRISELEERIKELEDEKFSKSTVNEKYENDDDWYSTHGQGD